MGVAFSGGVPPTDIVECVQLAEALGYESAWVAEGHGGDQFAILGACAVADTVAAARDAIRPAVGLYAGFFPRYNRLLAEAGFGDAVRAIKDAFDRGGREGAAKVVPDELIDTVALAGTPEACRDRLAAYRRAGLALPIVSPRVAGPDAKETAMTAIRACAP